MYWTVEDLNAGRCEVGDLGKLRPAEVADEVLPAVDLTHASLREQLRVDALQAYRELGGVAYLKSKPELLDKLLVKSVLPEPPSQGPKQKLDDMPWVSAQRLAYRLTPQTVDLEAPSDATPKEPARAQDIEPWKEVPERGVLLRPVKP